MKCLNYFISDVHPVVSPYGCPDDWISWNNFCYKRIEQLLTWNDAKQKCLEYGGNLASVVSAQENDFIFGLSKKKLTWIGGNDITNEGTWVWNDGTPWSYKNWKNGEPNDFGENEDCLDIGHHGNEWNDETCSKKYNAICKMQSRRTTDATIPTTTEPSETASSGNS